MKKYILILGIIIASSALMAQLSVGFNNSFSYSDNIFHLSDKDSDRFENGYLDSNGIEKFGYIKTKDDMIWNGRFSANYKNKLSRNFAFNINSRFNYKAYLKNDDKNRYSCSAALNLDIFKKLNWGLQYNFLPDNYSRQYIDKDGTQKYQKYTYDKDLFKSDVEFRFIRKAYLLASLKYEIYRYNKYFTEYDGNATTYGIGLRYVFSDLFLEGWYYFRDFDTEKDLTLDLSISDQTHESDKYFIQLKMKKIKCKSFDIRPAVAYSFEKILYDGDDSLHATRQDDTSTLSPYLKFYFSKNLNITLDYSLKYRNVSSDVKSVEDSKSYTENQFSISFETPIKF